MKKIIFVIIVIACIATASTLFGQQRDVPLLSEKEYQIEYVRLDNSTLKFSSIDPEGIAVKLFSTNASLPKQSERLRLQYQRLDGTMLTTFDMRQWAVVEGNAYTLPIVYTPVKEEITLTSEQVYATVGETLVLSFTISSDAEVSIEIVTTQGKPVISGRIFGLRQGLNTVQIPIRDKLHRGMYLFRLRTTGNAMANGAIIIQ